VLSLRYYSVTRENRVTKETDFNAQRNMAKKISKEPVKIRRKALVIGKLKKKGDR